MPYDDLSAAVSTVLYGRVGGGLTTSGGYCSGRTSASSVLLPPGCRRRHEKGGVEGQVGRVRRTHLSPMPVGETLAELIERIWGATLSMGQLGRWSSAQSSMSSPWTAAVRAPLTADAVDPCCRLRREVLIDIQAYRRKSSRSRHLLGYVV